MITVFPIKMYLCGDSPFNYKPVYVCVSTHASPVHALQRQAMELGVPLGVVSSKVAAERVVDVMGRTAGCATGVLLSSIRRVCQSLT